MMSVDRDGFTLEIVREGHGTPMLVLGAAHFYPQYFPAAMRNHFEMVFCDLRQWARTPPGFNVNSIDLDTFADDVEAIRLSLAFDRPIVMGQSQHGALALDYARRYPDSVRGVVAVGPPPPASGRQGHPDGDTFFNQDASPERIATHAKNLATRPHLDEPTTPQEFIEAYVSDDAMTWYDYTFDCSHLWEGTEINIEVVAQLFADENLPAYDVDNQLTPTLLTLGRYDYYVPYVYWDEPKTRLSPLTYRLYDKSGHHPPYEEPDRFTADVVAWATDL
jgi:proline iminopeptidase